MEVRRLVIMEYIFPGFTPAAVVDDAIKFVSDKSSSIEPKLEKHKVDKKHNNNDIQG
jgi:hypothetical protein